MPKSSFTRGALAAACAAMIGVGLGAASAQTAYPDPGGGTRFTPLPADARDAFNSPAPETAVDSKPEIDALQDRRAEWRYREQVEQARAREAMKQRLGAADEDDLRALNGGAEAARRDSMLPGRVSSQDPFFGSPPSLTEEDVTVDAPRSVDGPRVTHDEDGRPVLR
ncbi:hypothetical protein [Albimonas pacifica]|uniref:Uncharacterized protein n=1 Tax=Albimonas pacifica TaxID=1114924 RepID=A0A1I3LWU1_9RHOB|nr:hypothetical protein [Albimonas pacifica]SFI88926.1 hypothetical protein SAMN05216258_110201 [Albimonas pacifica]